MKFALKLVIWIFVACLCVWVLIAGFGARVFAGLPWGGWVADRVEQQQQLYEKNMAPDETVSAQGIVTQIDVDLNWANLELYETNEERVRVEISSAQKNEFTVRESDGRLTVRQQQNSWRLWIFNFARQSARVTIYVPRTFAGGLLIDTASGSVTAYDAIKASELTVNSMSGRTEFRAPIDARRVNIDSASGRIEIAGIRTDECRVESLSGSIRINALEAAHFNIECASGSVTLEKIVGGGKVDSTSGSLRMDFERVTDDVELHVVSGSVRISMPSDADIYTDIETVSGNVDNDFSRSNGQYCFKVEGLSGRIDIEAR